MQRLRDKLARSEKTAKAEAQLKVKIWLLNGHISAKVLLVQATKSEIFRCFEICDPG